MKIIYMHHAERDIDNNIPTNSDGITKRGTNQAEVLAEKMKDINIDLIVSSEYKRCLDTANIINKYHNVDIILDSGFNEKEKDEEYKKFLERNIKSLKMLYKKYSNKTILCVTSGVNLGAFICYFYNIKPTNKTPWAQAIDLSPINFVKGSGELD